MSVDLNKRSLLKKAGAAACATTVAGALAPTIYAKNLKVEVDMFMAWPAAFPGFTPPIRKSVDAIYEQTGGEIKINIYGAGQTLPDGSKLNPFAALDMVTEGRAAMVNTAAYYYTSKSPIFLLYTKIPFGMTTQQHVGWLESGAGEAYDAWLKKEGMNVKAIRGMSTGLQAGGWFRKEINSIEDFKGLRFRIPGMGGDVIRRVGGDTISMPGGKIPGALKSGELDATEWVGPYLDSKIGLYKMVKYYYTDGFHEPGAVLTNFVNLDFWNGLTDRQRGIIQSCFIAHQFSNGSSALLNENINAFEMFKREGVQIKQYSQSVRNALKKASDEIFNEKRQTNADTERFFASYDDYRKRSGDYLKVFDDTIRCERPVA